MSEEPAKPAPPVRKATASTRQKAAAVKGTAARLARDPELRKKVRQVWTTAAKLYGVAASPEARKLYREARDIVRDTWKHRA
ncbi:hypothetical protein ACFQ36_16705 [Arthrobacter sp. GCM10027362]|uniref:hypothetical protein n=1 Tax=Arthrobacter sp. GCM10027362 TaxID=3273379 RepID=UPI0036371AF5